MAILAPFLAAASSPVAAAPLDDAYIHLQYARSITEGHPFAYHPGEAPSSGASSVLWVVLLAPFHLWMDGVDVLWGAWALGAIFLALVFAAVHRWLSARHGVGAANAGVATLAAWGWLGWHSASGMEVGLTAAAVACAWLLTDRWDRSPQRRRYRDVAPLLALGVVLPWIRPETAPFACAIGALLMVRPPGDPRAPRFLARLLGVVPLLFVASLPLFWWAVTGAGRTNGMSAKWLPVHPYFDTESLLHRVGVFLKVFRDWVDGSGRHYAEGYFPIGVVAVALVLGLVLALRPARGRLATVLMIGASFGTLGVLLTYGTFHDHKFRYLVPFIVPPLALAGAVVHRLARRSFRRLRSWAPAAASVPVLAFCGVIAVVSWPRAVDHYARATGEIRAQHYVIAAAMRELRPEAVVAVNDAGALAYLGGHRTIDLVGLTTNGWALAFLEGGGSRHELLESRRPRDRPSHFATHTGWWSGTYLFGPEILEVAEVPRPTAIVGGPILTLRESELAVLDRGAEPVSYELRAELSGATLLDELDVADAESESAHRYENGEREFQDNLLGAHPGLGVTVYDGGWRAPAVERFQLAGDPERELVLVMRTEGFGALRLRVNGEDLPTEHLEGAGWLEVAFEVPTAPTLVVEVRRSRHALPSYHWWLYALPENWGRKRDPRGR